MGGADYLSALGEMFEQTHTEAVPWTTINGNKRKAARLAVLGAVYKALRPLVPRKPAKTSDEVMKLARATFG